MSHLCLRLYLPRPEPEETRQVLCPRVASGVVLQVLEWKGGSDATIEDRIDRISKLQNQPG